MVLRQDSLPGHPRILVDLLDTVFPTKRPRRAEYGSHQITVKVQQ
jgi:hypothetical protein